MHLSVIICTHNPREDYLRRTLKALENQTLPKDQWELLLIDNASKELLAGNWDLSWHTSARHVREEQLGLTPARLRGIQEAQGVLLVFVDDDNVLDSDYLEHVSRIANHFPWIGAYGGSSKACFDVLPEGWQQPSIGELGLRTVLYPAWGLGPGIQNVGCAPIGAGMAVRRDVAIFYHDLCKTDPLRNQLDRKGKSLASCGDYDLALCSCRMNLAVGIFPELCLSHLIPEFRTKREYLLNLTENIAESFIILGHIHGDSLPKELPAPCRSQRILEAYQRWRKGALSRIEMFEFEVLAARKKGRQRGIARLKEMIQNSPT
jgi:glycosyltransferase involved in cell wall biosynthesis